MSGTVSQPGRALQDRVALITGAASGIGRAIAVLFGGEGAAVAVADVDEIGGRQVVAEIEGAGGRAIFLPVDVTQPADCERAVRAAFERFGSVNVLVNNAGIVRRASILDATEDDWDRTMAVNVKSIFLLSRVAIPAMIDVGGGVIINMGSGWGLVGGPDAAAYCASKGAVVQLTRAMAIDHGKHNIRVNCICPGDTDTPILRGEARQLGEVPERFLRQAAERPLQRIGQPEDIAQAALYLASDASSFVTGSVLVVDGGGIAG